MPGTIGIEDERWGRELPPKEGRQGRLDSPMSKFFDCGQVLGLEDAQPALCDKESP
jgi:hypothetical protein